MENIEIMNEGMDCVVEEIVADEAHGIGTGATVLLTVLGTLAVGAGIKLAKKAYDAHKAKTELRKPEKEIYAEPEDIEDVATK